MPADPTWDFQDPRGKPRLLATLARETDELLALVAPPEHWRAPTACTGWEVRDMVGHLVDATEGYLAAFELARTGRDPDVPPVGLSGAAAAYDRAARAFRGTPRDAALARLREGSRRLLAEFESLSDAEWPGLAVPDPHVGPLPAMHLAAAITAGVAVHRWDVAEGLGRRSALDADAADIVLPLVPLLWVTTADTSAVDEPYDIGVRTTGRHGGETRFTVAPSGLGFHLGDLDGCSAVLEVDPGTLVLIAYGRVSGGTVHGDRASLEAFRTLFVPI